MNRRKQNISRWYALGLAAVLVISSLILATGIALARYRTEYKETIKFVTGEPGGIYLGAVDEETGTFDVTATGNWEQVENTLQLDFSVANGVDQENCAERTQVFHVRLIGSLGIGQDETLPTIKLIDPTVHDSTKAADENEGYTAEPIRIVEGSLLHTTFGDGWVYCFLDEEGEELTWVLEGGEFSCVGLCALIVLDDNTQLDTSFLQLQVLGEMTD